MFEDLEPRPARGAPLIALTREDLDFGLAAFAEAGREVGVLS